MEGFIKYHANKAYLNQIRLTDLGRTRAIVRLGLFFFLISVFSLMFNLTDTHTHCIYAHIEKITEKQV